MSGTSDYYSLFSDYLTNQKANSANTRESYLRDALYFLEYLSNAGIDPLEADEQVIQGYVEHLHDLKRSPTTISRNLASVRCFYKFLIFRGLMDSNPAKGIKLEKTVKKLPQVLSGEEIELLLAQPVEDMPQMTILGCTEDISAGQLIDRTGKLLNLTFPSGKAVDALARGAEEVRGFSVKVKDLTFSLSGVENQVKAQAENGTAPAQIARFVLETVAGAVVRTTRAALERYPGLPVLCSGGVASNGLLRERMTDAVFAPPQYSTDNALGVAILAGRALKQEAST